MDISTIFVGAAEVEMAHGVRWILWLSLALSLLLSFRWRAFRSDRLSITFHCGVTIAGFGASLDVAVLVMATTTSTSASSTATPRLDSIKQ